MRELFSERDITRVSYYQMVLEGEGIPTFLRNENLSRLEVSIPVFFPALCVVNDDDYERAIEVMKAHVRENEALAGQEIACPKCGETNPGNFDTCWSCSAALR